MLRTLAGALAILTFLGTPGAASGLDQNLLLREELQVKVDGTAEVWRLIWRKAPKSICDAEDVAWMTCPCAGFAFGEGGDLDLVRFRLGREIDRLHLTPFFGHDDFPTTDKIAILQRWDVRDQDLEDHDSKHFSESVSKRPVTKVMKLADYNHDGDANEFFLQTGVLPCGKRVGVVIGLSTLRPRLHAFGSVLHPDQPLYLFKPQWDALLKSGGPQTVMD
jgi:hypothetical protein